MTARKWSYERYVRAVFPDETIESFARHVAAQLSGPDTAGVMTDEQARETVLATVASSAGEAADRSRDRRAVFAAWQAGGFEARLIGEIMAQARAFADEGACPECNLFGAHEGICAGPDPAADPEVVAAAALHLALRAEDHEQVCAVCGCLGKKHRLLNAMCPPTVMRGVDVPMTNYREYWQQTTFFKKRSSSRRSRRSDGT